MAYLNCPTWPLRERERERENKNYIGVYNLKCTWLLHLKRHTQFRPRTSLCFPSQFLEDETLGMGSFRQSALRRMLTRSGGSSQTLQELHGWIKKNQRESQLHAIMEKNSIVHKALGGNSSSPALGCREHHWSLSPRKTEV